jgi:hypothetical protein
MHFTNSNFIKRNWLEFLIIIALVLILFLYDAFLTRQNRSNREGEFSNTLVLEQEAESANILHNNPFAVKNGLKVRAIMPDSLDSGSIPTACLFGANTRPGDTGPHVFHMQNFLSYQGYLTEEPNGFYGPATEAAVRAFQTAYPEIWKRANLSGPTTWFYTETRRKARDVCEETLG